MRATRLASNAKKAPEFAKKAKIPLPRFPQRAYRGSTYELGGRPIIRNVSKPHIFYDNHRKKWVCGNFYAVGYAAKPVTAWRDFLRQVKKKEEGWVFHG